MKEHQIRDMYEKGGQSDVFKEVYNDKGNIIRKERDLTKIQKEMKQYLNDLHIHETVTIDDAKELLQEYMRFQSSVATIINNATIDIPEITTNDQQEMEVMLQSYHIKCIALDESKNYEAVRKEMGDIKPKIIHYPQAVSGEKISNEILQKVRGFVLFHTKNNNIRFRPERINKYNILIDGNTIYITDLVCDMGQFYVNQHYHEQIEEYNNRRRDIKLSLQAQENMTQYIK